MGTSGVVHYPSRVSQYYPRKGHGRRPFRSRPAAAGPHERNRLEPPPRPLDAPGVVGEVTTGVH